MKTKLLVLVVHLSLIFNSQFLKAAVFSGDEGAAVAVTGKISGKVSDKITSEDLIGITVVIEGTTTGVATDLDGRFELRNLKPGKYKIVFKFLSYQTKVIDGVEVEAGKATTLNVLMEENSQIMNEVQIVSTFKQETIGAMYSIQKNNVSIADGISADLIKRSPDKNTGEVLKRVSGASIQDNKYVIIRGLSDRYNTAVLNKALLPSTEPDKKSFSFDLIPANMVDQILISKTASPDLPGDFAGGVVSITTKDFPEENFLSVAVGSGINSQSTFKNFKSGERLNQDYFASGASERALPSSFPADSKTYVELPAEEKYAVSKSFKNNWKIYDEHNARPSSSFQVSTGVNKSIGKESSFGSILSLSYRNSENIEKIERYDYDFNRNTEYAYLDEQYKFNTTVGGLANFSYILNKANKFSFKNLYNRIFDDKTTLRTGENTASLQYVRSNSMEITERSILSSQVSGEHNIKDKLMLDWNGAYGLTRRDEPDMRKMVYAKNFDSGTELEEPFLAYIPIGSASPNYAGRFYSSLNEKAYSGAVNAQLPFKVLGEKQSFKAGYFKQDKEREFSARVLGYVQSAGSSLDFSQPQDSLFAPENIGKGALVISDITNRSNQYSAKSSLNAVYGMMDNRVFEKIRIVWGMRIENYNQQLTSADNTNMDVNIDETYIDYLPSINTTYSLTEKMNFRLAYSQTVAKPEFRELAPFSFYDFNTSCVIEGNPELKRSKIKNYDFKYEFYPMSSQLISTSVFYKEFKDPIEQVIVPGGGSVSRIRTFQNVSKATNLGVEFEYRLNLDLINGMEWAKGITLFSNLALIKSEVKVSDTLTRSLQGQSPYLINSGIQYYNRDNGWGSSILYNRIGRRIAEVGTDGYGDIYEEARSIVDFQLSKALGKHMELKFSISDLLNKTAIFYQDEDEDGKFDAINDNLMKSVKYGSSYGLSFAYKF